MARRATKRAVQTEEHLDATPERLQKGEESDLVNPADIDPLEQDRGVVRRFRANTTLDRLLKNERITYHQWFVGDWYGNTYRQAIDLPSVVANYGERTGGGEISYGMPRTERQCDARRLWREARSKFPADMVGFMDRLLLHDEMPRYGGSAFNRSVQKIADALQELVKWQKLG